MALVDLKKEFLITYIDWKKSKMELEELNELLKQGQMSEEHVQNVKDSFEWIDYKFRIEAHMMQKLNEPKGKVNYNSSDQRYLRAAYKKLGFGDEPIDLENVNILAVFNDEVKKLRNELLNEIKSDKK